MNRAGPILAILLPLLAGSLLTGDGRGEPLRTCRPEAGVDPAAGGPLPTAGETAPVPLPPQSPGTDPPPPIREPDPGPPRSPASSDPEAGESRTEEPARSAADPSRAGPGARTPEAEPRPPESDREPPVAAFPQRPSPREAAEPRLPAPAGAPFPAALPVASGHPPPVEDGSPDRFPASVDPYPDTRAGGPNGTDPGGEDLPTVRLRPPSEAVAAGELLELEVEIDTAAGVSSAPFHLLYPPELLEFVDGRAEGFLGPDADLLFMADGAPGRLFVALTVMRTGPGETGSGKLCRLRFRTLREGIADLRFEDAHLFAGSRREIAGRFLPAAVEILPTAAGDGDPPTPSLALPPPSR